MPHTDMPHTRTPQTAAPQTDASGRVLLAYLRDLQQAGVEVLPRIVRDEAVSQSPAASSAADEASPSAASPGTPTETERKPIAPAAGGAPTPTATGGPSTPERRIDMADPSSASPEMPEKSTAPTLELLAEEVAACTRCAELAATRTQTVFADGNPRARLVFLGEAPGADEDRQGKPFVGRAGKLLTDIIENGMKLRRSDVYIMNILKCRPPGNRTPLPQEAANCRPYLLRQFELVAPEFVCCLGACAAQNLLQTTQPIGKLRGRFYDWQGIRVMCTYHPAYLLRNPPAKRQTWEDIQMLMQEMGLK